MSVPPEVVLTLALGLLVAVASVIVAGRLASQLKEAQARLLNEVAAREKAAHLLEGQEAAKVRLLEDHASVTARLSSGHEEAAARLAEARDALKARAEEAEAALAEVRAELAEARGETMSLKLEVERRGDALAQAKEVEAAALGRVEGLEATIAALTATAAEKARELAGTKELLASARSEVKGAQAELRRASDHLVASQREALGLGDRASRLEKQLFDSLAASKLEKQLLDALGASQASGAELGKALHKAESDAWREKTAKESSLLEARSLREDIKRVQVRLAGEIARREEQARQWAEARSARAGSGEAVEARSDAAEKRVSDLDLLEKALAPPPPPSEAVVSIPAAARSIRPRSTAPVSKRAAPPEEPKKIASWWCQICGRGGTQLATACKHQWIDNEMV